MARHFSHLDVCINEVTPIIFCDEEGYDIIPIHMVKVFHEGPNTNTEDQESTTNEIKPQDLKLCEEVSIHDINQWSESSEEENDHRDQVYYDASDKLEDFEEPDPIIVQLRDGKEITIPQESKELQKRR